MSEDPGESYVIHAILRQQDAAPGRTQGLDVRQGPGDDAAWLHADELVTTDVMVEGVHFDGRLSPEDLGWKLVAVNASDIGAMGGRPSWALLTISLPSPLDRGWVDAFARGLGAGLARFGATLVGGDTTRSPGPVFAGLTLGGRAARPVLRSGARAGHELWVPGTLGEAAAGFLLGSAAGLAWLRRPDPPVDFGAALGEAGLCTAMMDLSDGLLRDLGRLCRASRVGAVVLPAALPLGPALLGVADPLPCQVGFGDDYQLLFAARPEDASAIRALGVAHGVAVTRVGELTEGEEVVLSGREWPPPLFAHFEGAGP